MSSQETVDLMASVWREIGSFCDDLSEQEWKTLTDCPGWSVQDQLSHLFGSESRILGRPAPDHTPVDLSHVKNESGARNEVVVDWRRPWSGAQVLAEFRDLTSERLGLLRAMREDDFAAETQTPIGPGTVQTFLEIRIFDAWIHLQDMRPTPHTTQRQTVFYTPKGFIVGNLLHAVRPTGRITQLAYARTDDFVSHGEKEGGRCGKPWSIC